VTEVGSGDTDFFADAHGSFLSTLGFELHPERDLAADGVVGIDPYLQAEGVPWPNMATLLTLADVLIGRLASRNTAPRISVTADLGVRLFRPVAGERVVVSARLRKVGRTMSVGDATIHLERTGELVGTSLGTFLASPRPGDHALSGFPPERRATRRAGTLREHIGITSPEPGVAELGTLRPDVVNATQSLQGGVAALLGEVATYSAVGGLDGPAQVVDTLGVHYLAAGRDGPFVATAEPLERTAARSSFRVELRDGGRDRVIALIETTTRPLVP
jgi:acyl-coenzyme A thioesterase PaaI-like protein